MVKNSTGGRLLEAFLYALSSLLFYHLGFGIVFFLVPLQIASVRRGWRGLLLTTAIVLSVMVALRAFRYVRSPGDGILIIVEMAVVLLMILGVHFVNLQVLRRFRGLVRLCLATVAVGVLSVPLVLVLPSVPAFHAAMAKIFAEISKVLGGMFSQPDSVAAPFIARLLEPASLMSLFGGYFLKSFLLAYLVLLCFSWWAGAALASRATPPATRVLPPRLAAFHMEGFWLWPLILSGALILLDLFFGLPPLAAIAWNAGLILLFLYALQGVAIVRFLFEKFHIPRLLWIVLLAGMVALAVSPQVNLFFLIALPLFGISENWIRYRIPAADTSGKE